MMSMNKQVKSKIIMCLSCLICFSMVFYIYNYNIIYATKGKNNKIVLENKVSGKKDKKQKLLYDKKVVQNIDYFTYIWLSGNSKQYAEKIEEFKNILNYAKESKDEKSFLLGKMYLSLFNYDNISLLISGMITSDNNLYLQRINLINYLININNGYYNIGKFVKNKQRFKDYDYLWVGNYYLLKGKYNEAKQYYIEGITKTKQLLKSFDILIEVANSLPKTRIKRDFIISLPYIRSHDAFYFISKKLYLKDYSFKIVNIDDFDIKNIFKNINKKVFPIYTRGDSAYLSMGDILMIIYVYSIYHKDKFNEINNTQITETYLSKPYQKIASYLYKNNIIQKYMDGKIHVDSPISGFEFAKIFYKFDKISINPFVKTNKIVNTLKKRFGLDDYKIIIKSIRAYKDEEYIKQNLQKNIFIFYKNNKYKYFTLADLCMFFKLYFLANGKDITMESKHVSENLIYLPQVYRDICGYMINKKYIKIPIAKNLEIDYPINNYDLNVLIERFITNESVKNKNNDKNNKIHKKVNIKNNNNKIKK